MRRLPYPEPRHDAGLEFDPAFFSHIDDCLTEGSLLDDPTAENLKMTELLYLIVSHGDCCIKSKLLGNVDAARDNLQQIVYSNIFSDISVEEIAKRCNRSLTSFKRNFSASTGPRPTNGSSGNA